MFVYRVLNSKNRVNIKQGTIFIEEFYTKGIELTSEEFISKSELDEK